MSTDNFDNEIAKLYQQRKAQIIAPQVSLRETSKPRRLTLTSLLAIFSTAGITSFGIMAIISHLSNAPIKKTPIYSGEHSVEVVTIMPNDDDDKNAVIVQKKLPPKPLTKNPKMTEVLGNDNQVSSTVIEPTTLATAQIKYVNLPQLKEPELAIKPIYKVLPQYPLHPNKNKQTGQIQLKYQITAMGGVKNIIIINSSVNRELQLSAKKALAKWQYEPNNKFKDSYEIIFEFNNLKK